MKLIWPALVYVFNDQFFWLAMAVTVLCGLFIGAVLYDGVLREAKKAILVLASYGMLISMTNIARVLSVTEPIDPSHYSQPLASTATIIYVTIFYLLGMFLGVLITNKAHKGRESRCV